MNKGPPFLEKYENSQASAKKGCSTRKDDVKGHRKTRPLKLRAQGEGYRVQGVSDPQIVAGSLVTRLLRFDIWQSGGSADIIGNPSN